MENNNNANVPTISIKTIEKNVSRTFTDKQSNMDILNQIATITHRSFNDVLKEIVNNFIQNGKIYGPDKNKYYTVDEIIKEINPNN